jgi:excisionase family DNA binding protein
MNRILTTDETAEVLKVTPRKAREWLKAGKIPGRKIGKEWRVAEAALMEHLGRREVPAATAAERAARVRSVRGKYAHLPTSSDDFIRRKQEEIEREEAAYARRWSGEAS